MTENIGDKIRKTLEAVYRERHDYAPTTLDAHDGLDRRFYEEMTRRFQENGYTLLGDLEDLTVTQSIPAYRTCIRVFVGEGGRVTGAIYHVRLKGLLRVFQWIGMIPRNLRVIDLETEFHNGTFLGATNAPTGHELSNGPRVRMNHFKGWELDRLLKSHREAIAAHALANNTRPVLLGSMGSVIESQQRMNFLKAVHRKSVGGITRDELRALGGVLVANDIIDEVYRQVKDAPTTNG